MKNIVIRLGEKKDIRVINKLSTLLCEYDRDNFDSSLKCDWLNSGNGNEFLTDLLNNENSCVLLAEIDNEIVGYLFGGIVENIQWRTIKKQSELIEIYVLDKYRGNKIGNHLFNEFKDWSINKGVENIKVLVSYGNEKSINFYKKIGFDYYDVFLEYNI